MDGTIISESLEFSNVRQMKDNPLLSYVNIKVMSKGHSANRSTFNESVCNQLKESLPGVPIIGRFSKRDGDYTNHDGKKQAIGFVDSNSTVKYVKEGAKTWLVVENAYLWTGLYEGLETAIVGNPQSMELYKDFDGKWFIDEDDKPTFEFTKARVQALCVLGKKVSPGFPGAKFYEKIQDITSYDEATFDELISSYAALSKNQDNAEEKKSNEDGDKPTNFSKEEDDLFIKISFNDMKRNLYQKLNPETLNDEGEKVRYMNYSVMDISQKDDVSYGLVYNYEDRKYYRQYFSQAADGSVVLNNREVVEVQAVTENEAKILEEATNKFEETLKEFAALGVEKKEDLEKLVSFKKETELKERKSLISKYNLTEEEVKDIDLESFSTIKDLEKELVFTAFSLGKDLAKKEEGDNKPDTSFDKKEDGKEKTIFNGNTGNPEKTDEPNTLFSLVKKYSH